MSAIQIIIKSVVDFTDSKYRVYGVVKSIEGEKVTLSFTEANHPEACEKCGSSVNLSVNGGSGEVECLRTGCGHRHGFKEWEEDHLISELTLAPEKFQPK